jgi:hypothetical protein
LEEIQSVFGDRKPEEIVMKDSVFQEVDFSPMSAADFRKYNWAGANFWGCTFPAGSY